VRVWPRLPRYCASPIAIRAQADEQSVRRIIRSDQMVTKMWGSHDWCVWCQGKHEQTRHSPHCHLSKLTPTRFDAGNVGRNRIRAAQTRTSTASRSAHRITSELSRSRSVAKSPLTNQARSSSTNQCATGTTRTPPGKPKQNRLVKTRGLGSKQSRPCPAIWMAGGIGAFAPPAFPARIRETACACAFGSGPPIRSASCVAGAPPARHRSKQKLLQPSLGCSNGQTATGRVAWPSVRASDGHRLPARTRPQRGGGWLPRGSRARFLSCLSAAGYGACRVRRS